MQVHHRQANEKKKAIQIEKWKTHTQNKYIGYKGDISCLCYIGYTSRSYREFIVIPLMYRSMFTPSCLIDQTVAERPGSRDNVDERTTWMRGRRG